MRKCIIRKQIPKCLRIFNVLLNIYLKRFAICAHVLFYGVSAMDVIFDELQKNNVNIVAIDIPGGKRSLVKNIIAQTTILKRAIKK